MMDPGQFTKRVQVKKLTEAMDSGRTPKKGQAAFEARCIIWCKENVIRGNEKTVSNQQAQIGDVEWITHFRSDILATDQLVYERLVRDSGSGASLPRLVERYEIVALIPDGDLLRISTRRAN